MSAGIHIGKTMLQMVPALPATATAARNILKPRGRLQLPDICSAIEDKAMAPAASVPLSTKPIWVCRADHTYIITGGLGGFGLALAQWLVCQGATHLVLTSTRGIRTGPQRAKVEALRRRGVHVELSLLDVGVEKQAAQLLLLANGIAPIAGIFHLAMIMKDKLMVNQTGEGWNGCVVPKALGAINLDMASRKLPNPLDVFVIFSSAIVEGGNPGQANYAYGNAACNEVCVARKAALLPGTNVSIQWGMVDNVGFVAEQKGNMSSQFITMKVQPQHIDDCLRVLGHILAGGHATPPVMASHAATVGGKMKQDDETVDLVTAVLDIVGMKMENTDENAALSKLGADSMQVVEVRATVQRVVGRPFPLEEIGTLTVAKLRDLAADAGQEMQRSASAPSGTQEEAGQGVFEPAAVTREAQQAADELDALLRDAKEDEV